jgi:hypothetical protein
MEEKEKYYVEVEGKRKGRGIEIKRKLIIFVEGDVEVVEREKKDNIFTAVRSRILYVIAEGIWHKV